ncbi:hypothetical protein Tco_0307891 [Tanacetum coccineum]
MSKDLFPKSSQYNAEHYATLVAYPTPFHKYLEPFLCLVGISRYYTLDENTYPQFLHDNNEREWRNVEELMISIDVIKVLVTLVCMRSAEVGWRRLRLWAPVGLSVSGKSSFRRSEVYLSGHVLNAEFRGLIISSHIVPHHSGANIAEAEVDSIARSAAPIIATIVTTTVDVTTTTREAPAREAPAREAPAKPSLFAAGSSSAGGTDPAPGGFSDVSGSDFLVGGIRTVIDPESNLQKVYVPQWSVTNGSCLDDGRVCREIPANFTSAASENASVNNIKRKARLESAVVEEKDDVLRDLQLPVRGQECKRLLTRCSCTSVTKEHAVEVSSAGTLGKKISFCLGAAIGKAIEKGMQEGLSRAALHRPQSGKFSLTTDNNSTKMPVRETIMIFSLMKHLADSTDWVLVQKIKENLANRVSALRNVFIPLSEPLSVAALTGTKSTSAVVAAPAGTTTALSVTFASASVVRPISTDDYEVVQVDSHEGGGMEDQIGGNNVDPFPSVDEN